MDRKSLIASAKKRLLEKFNEREASNLAKYLLEDLVPKEVVVDDEITQLIDKAILRLLDNEPLQYVTHRSDFYGYQFYVNEAVLIPRPETEELVYHVLKFLKRQGLQNPTILDIGTGSGCIPITLKKEFDRCKVSALDVSTEALTIAIRNANQLGASVTFFQNDILVYKSFVTAIGYDIIVSNPPYIPASESTMMSRSTLKHEPKIALFTEDEFGLVFYQRIADLSAECLNYNGAVFLELNEYHADKIKKIYQQTNTFSSIEIVNDLQGKPRILIAIR